MTALKIFILVGLISATSCEEGFFDKLKSGLQSMRNYLETVKEVADLVSDSLKKQPDRKKGDESPQEDAGDRSAGFGSLASVFFRLLGLDSPKIAAITVNSAIFLAQVIASFFEVKSSRDESDDSEFDVLKSIVDSTDDKVQNLLKQAQSPELPRKITEQLDGMDLSCVKLLICKMTPFILKAQASLKSESNNGSRKTVFTSWLPSKEEFEDNSENCEQEHKDCRVFPEEFEQE
ncbi:uncharacterized protein LOC123263175 [Cotesia glomerata]|uniref:Uncharacterized protein n=1 Tax=Cotesia glomerata TaxID=32391 RepID=A0AAV7ILY2_COTGL|nr:uncharacterized protein LOC123263175 [Cotesia glomerata]KAH0553551.1 hypothetical protein KQX54_002122 [Cotesia glomerata]